MPRGKFSNIQLLYLFQKVEYLGLNVQNHTRELIKQQNKDNAHFEDINNKCDEIYESLEVKKENKARAAQITQLDAAEAAAEVAAAEKQKK